jgi:hypothetical protein
MTSISSKKRKKKKKKEALFSLQRTKKLLANARGKGDSFPSSSSFRFLLCFLFYAFLFAGFLSSGENSNLSRACSRSTWTPKYQQLHPPLSSCIFTIMDRPLSSTTGRIYGVIKIDDLKPRSTLFHQFSVETCPFSSIIGDPAFR